MQKVIFMGSAMVSHIYTLNFEGIFTFDRIILSSHARLCLAELYNVLLYISLKTLLSSEIYFIVTK